MNVVLWVLQVLLAFAFIVAGFGHVMTRKNPRKGMEWMVAVPAPLMLTIGILEILGGIGLIVPAATGILPILTPVAATALAVLMVFAAIFHLRRPGEMPNVIFNLVLGAIAAFIAYGRFVLEPIS